MAAALARFGHSLTAVADVEGVPTGTLLLFGGFMSPRMALLASRQVVTAESLEAAEAADAAEQVRVGVCRGVPHVKRMPLSSSSFSSFFLSLAERARCHERRARSAAW